MKCYIAKDLLSNYIDGLNSAETDAAVKEHLDNCGACRAVYEKMTASFPDDLAASKAAYKEVDFLKDLKMRIRQKNIVVLLVCLAALTLFVVVARNYDIVLDFDPDHMSVESFRAAVLVDEDGKTSWEELTPDTPGYDPSKDYDNTLKLVRLAFRSISGSISEMSIGRDIHRNGQSVRVVYYRYTKTLWDSLFLHLGALESGSSYGTDIYDDSYMSQDFGTDPQMKEIYYLPVKDLDKIDRLSDQEYDAQRENAILVWSGVI